MNGFAEVEPNQEERIILASKKANNVIGYIWEKEMRPSSSER